MTSDGLIQLLKRQLVLAVAHLRQKDATEEACAKRMETMYAARFAELQDSLSRMQQSYAALLKRSGVYANNYARLREMVVSLPWIGVTATGERLDEIMAELATAEPKAA